MGLFYESCIVKSELNVVDVPRHAPRVIKLSYVGEGPIDTTLMLVGKVTCNFLTWLADYVLLFL
jgi:hypothetical protein